MIEQPRGSSNNNAATNPKRITDVVVAIEMFILPEAIGRNLLFGCVRSVSISQMSLII